MVAIARTSEASSGPLRATVVEIGSVCTVSLSGELDLSNVETVSQLLLEFEAGGGETIVFDLERLVFIDSSGLAMLLDAYIRFQDHGARRMRIVPSRDPSVRRIFTITGLDERLPFVSDGPPQ